MTTLRCTAKAFKRFKLVAEESPPPSTGKLGDWYVNLLNVERHRLVLCVAENSLLPVIVPAKQAEFPAKLADHIQRMLHVVGVSSDLVTQEIEALGDVRIGKTISRSVLGVMNDYKRMAWYYLDQHSPFEAAVILSDSPFNPLGFATPSERTYELLRPAWRRG
jgi:hypothetical protein